MRVYFWGTRGSLPASITAETIHSKLTYALREALRHNLSNDADIANFLDNTLGFSAGGSYGNNTSCVELKGGEEFMVCDAGTGIRDLGNTIPDVALKGKAVFNIFMSHFHWDHIQGFPFFTPAYIPGNRINIYGCHKDMEKAFVRQQEALFFPVPLDMMRADIGFNILEPGNEYEIGGFKVKSLKQNHPGDSYGYRFERDGKIAVYSTDSEHKGDISPTDYPFIDFCGDADLLIFDAQYAFLESIDLKKGWGHSSNILAVEIAVKARVKRLCLFHNEPACEDAVLDKFLGDARDYLGIYAEYSRHSENSPLIIDMAYDGLEIGL